MGGVVSTGLAKGSRLSLSVAGAANVALTIDQAQNAVLEFTGALTGSINVTIPDAVATAGASWQAFNNTTGAFTLTLKTVSGTGIAIAQGRKVIAYSDGVNLVIGVQQDAGRSAVVMASDANKTLTVAEAAAGIIEVTSSVTITAGRDLVVPLGDGRIIAVANLVTGASGTLTFKVLGGTGVAVAQGKRAIIYGNATDYVRLTADV